MPRAYLRLDPAYDERKDSYPDGPYAALIACFCQAELQPERGRFRSERHLRAVLGKRGRHVPYLIEHGDLARLSDGRLYIVGWDEWQEGDWKVGERVRRIRNRRRSDGTAALTAVTPDVTVGVTVTTVDILSDGDRLSVIDGAGRGGSAGGLPQRQELLAPKPNGDPPRKSRPTSTAAILAEMDWRSDAGAARLTKAQFDAWASFGSEWDGFKAAWLAKGLRWPPKGSPDDDPEATSPSQRALLYSILDARPKDLAKWVSEAPSRSASSVIAYVIERWHGVRDAVR